MKKTLLISIISLLCFSSFIFIKDGFLDDLKKQLHLYNQQYPEEKIYLQTDKPFYKPGESIWYNAFILNSTDHKPSTTSEVLYVELIDARGTVVNTSKLLIQSGTSKGDFELSDQAPGGIYTLKAYTKWMKNFGEEMVFSKKLQVQHIITPRLLLKLDFEKEAYGPGDMVRAELKVSNLKNEKVSNAEIKYTISLNGSKHLDSTAYTDQDGEANITFQLPDGLSSNDGLFNAIVRTEGIEESISRSIPIVLNKVTVQFFPEGGDMVVNQPTKMGFKALNEMNKGADISGEIIDNDGLLVTSFQSFHMGMGAFEFTPRAGKQYFAKISSPSGNEDHLPLPTTKSGGYTLQLKNHDDTQLQWEIYSPDKTQGYLVGQAHGALYYSEMISLSAGSNSIKVNTEDFPAGIAVFTLFNEKHLEQCERLVFINPHKTLKIQLETNHDDYQPREKVKLKIRTLDSDNQPVQGKLSLAVVDDKLLTFADDKQDNILSSLLLSSELKGEIQEPSFYFDPDEPKATEAMDYLLLTQGWRRFKWAEVQNPNKSITYIPEKAKNVAGRIVDKHDKPIHGEVTLMELGNAYRIINVTTTTEGHFLFKNADATVRKMLLTKQPNKIILDEQENNDFGSSDNSSFQFDYEDREILTPESKKRNKVVGTPQSDQLDISLSSDVQQLSEVVVTGYATVTKSSLTGSVSVVNYTNPEITNVAQALQGQVAGVQITRQEPMPTPNIRIRGVGSISGETEPLYVINGHPLASSANQNFLNSSFINSTDIQSVEILSPQMASALYGSRGANGALLITLKSTPYYNLKSEKKKAVYNHISIGPKKFSASREFYVAPPSKEEERSDFRSTIYWNPNIITNTKGEAEVSFYNNDEVSSFKITAEGFSTTGEIGRAEKSYFTQLPMSLYAKLPQYLGFEDTLRIPVQVKNETKKIKEATLKVNASNGFHLLEDASQSINVPPNEVVTVWYTLLTNQMEGQYLIDITLDCGSYSDKIHQKLNIKSVGFPRHLSHAASVMDSTYMIDLGEIEKGTFKAELNAYPSLLNDISQGIESILRTPHGCFEQVSSSTFPNILALQFMEETGSFNMEVRNRATRLIQDGYRRLMAYEIKGGGFEWFGHPAAHEALSAYGLLEFHEMAKVYSGVSSSMIKRTQDWLMSRKDGKGGFKQKHGKYGFSAASKEVNNAYIVYVMSETGSLESVKDEYDTALKEALKSKDMYKMALLASAAYNFNLMKDYQFLVDKFQEAVATQGIGELKANESIVRSYGKSLKVETVAFWTVALLKNNQHNLNLINECIQFLVSQRGYYGYGSTQATTLTLMAFTQYAKLLNTQNSDGVIELYAQNQLLNTQKYKEESMQLVHFDIDQHQLSSKGATPIRVKFSETGKAIPYGLNFVWHTKTPVSDKNCSVALKQQLQANDVNMNETVRLHIEIKNKKQNGLPMTIANIGIPAGLSLQPWQLKELQEKEVFDFYEIINDNLILYYTEMGPAETKSVDLDLKAELKGTFTAPASSAYLYYTEEFKDWEKGSSVTVH
ncbi:MG2 domain-containing protein [Fulvivirga ligni]|uniref:MG2 domain-containing protein n=1 Tax=Fulvivirga ligni TaxID=2904246 RepID=UPI001F408506|nr:MG2 domain-containing protein [Fulvivirga ligni]UII24201.1 TonB-dependent receptor plug domain-containing protein [Fulvivirga ligni]